MSTFLEGDLAGGDGAVSVSWTSSICDRAPGHHIAVRGYAGAP